MEPVTAGMIGAAIGGFTGCGGVLGIQWCRGQQKKTEKEDDKKSSDIYNLECGALEIEGPKIKVTGLKYNSETSNVTHQGIGSQATSKGYATNNTNMQNPNPSRIISTQPTSEATSPTITSGNNSTLQSPPIGNTSSTSVQAQDPEIHETSAEGLALLATTDRNEYNIGEISYTLSRDGSCSGQVKNTTMKVVPQQGKAAAASDEIDKVIGDTVGGFFSTLSNAISAAVSGLSSPSPVEPQPFRQTKKAPEAPSFTFPEDHSLSHPATLGHSSDITATDSQA